MSSRKIHGVFITGPDVAGNIAFAKLLKALLEPKHHPEAVGTIEMDSIIERFGMTLDDDLGEKFRQKKRSFENGEILPGNMTAEVFGRWYNEAIPDRPRLELLLVTGAPRLAEEMDILDKFTSRMVIDLPSCRSHANASLARKLAGANLRETDLKAIQAEHWNTYHTKTTNALVSLNGTCLRLDGKNPLKDQIKETLAYLRKTIQFHGALAPVPEKFVKKAENRFADPEHPVHSGIDKIEECKRQVAEAANCPCCPV